jgi:hypothetical protein
MLMGGRSWWNAGRNFAAKRCRLPDAKYELWERKMPAK